MAGIAKLEQSKEHLKFIALCVCEFEKREDANETFIANAVFIMRTAEADKQTNYARVYCYGNIQVNCGAFAVKAHNSEFIYPAL